LAHRANGPDVPLAQIAIGDIIEVRAGERVPVDGTITSGSGSLDESHITGESLPVPRQTGDKILAGTLNLNAVLQLRATTGPGETFLDRMARLIDAAQASKPQIQRLADRVSAVFVPVVIGIAALTFAGWIFAGGSTAAAIINAVSVLVIACPCALGLATPAAILAGTGVAAKHGILIRNADALEHGAKVNLVVFDKTGTLTEGKPTLTEIAAAPGHAENDLLRLAASVESVSEHPLAAAILAGAKKRNLALAAVDEFASITGQGVRGKVEGQVVTVGREDATVPEILATKAADLRQEGRTVFFVGVDGAVAGLLAVTDPIKASTPDAIAALHKLGLKIVMLTGDHAETAKRVAQKLGIDRVEAEVTPEKKHDAILQLKHDGAHVAMAGDGINDAPALAAADVGIAMGTGTDVAMESAGITLVKGDLSGLVRAIELSRATMGNIRLNLLFAFIYNGVGIPVAAGVLYPFFGLRLSPMLASAAMALSSVSVIANSLRLRNAIR
jgi:Cu+-exporting ATPase